VCYQRQRHNRQKDGYYKLTEVSFLVIPDLRKLVTEFAVVGIGVGNDEVFAGAGKDCVNNGVELHEGFHRRK
jgi:hypothetical protein